MINENEVTEVTENEQDVTEVTEDEQAQIQAEQERQEQERLEQERIEAERQEAEERAREQARIEHENFLNSFPDTTVFYQELKEEEEDNVKWLCGTVKDAHTAESYGWLDNHYDESELTLIKNIYYLKGYEKPEQSEEELQLERYHLIDRQIEEYLDAKVKEHNYKSVESCVSYYNSTDDKYRAEARAVSTWRDHIYHTGEQVWQSVLDGTVNYEDVDLQYIIGIAGDFTWPEVE